MAPGETIQPMKTPVALLLLALPGILSADARTFLISFHKPDALLIVDDAGKPRWKAKPEIKHPQDCGVTAAGNLLCSDYTGVLAIGLDNTVKWRYRIPEGTQNPLAYPLEKDRFLVGVEGPTLLREINREGKILKEIQLTTTHQKVHGQFRLSRKTAKGTYLVPFTLEGALREYDGNGKLVRDFGEYKLVVGALRLPDGNTLISFIDGLVEVDPAGKTVWDFVTKRDAPFPHAPMVGMCKLKNGNVVAAFYTKNPETPALIEIAPDRTIVHSVKVAGHSNIGNFQLLTDDFKPSPEVLLR